MKIYTKTGDTGETSLFAGGRVPKDHIRLHAYGTVDELNTILGLAVAHQVHPSLISVLQNRQHELFALGADLATPLDAEADWIQRLTPQFAQQLEMEIDGFESELPPLQNFILPSGTPAAAFLHQARTVCRRAERWMVTLKDDLNPETLIYINRLSDWLFVVSRVENARQGVAETIWKSR